MLPTRTGIFQVHAYTAIFYTYKLSLFVNMIMMMIIMRLFVSFYTYLALKDNDAIIKLVSLRLAAQCHQFDAINTHPIVLEAKYQSLSLKTVSERSFCELIALNL